MKTLPIAINTEKNRNREAFSFANINLLGKCNVDCFFCLGKDIEDLLSKHNQIKTHFSEWKNFEKFLERSRAEQIKKIYITGQNTDALVYNYVGELVDYLSEVWGFGVGLRTNGYLAHRYIDVMNRCSESSGISIHSLNPITNNMIMGRKDIPDWDEIIPQLERPRVSIVLNRCNQHEFFPLLQYLSKFKNIRYVQVRRVCTDTRTELLAPDVIAYEQEYTKVRQIFPLTRRLWEDAEEYSIYGMPVVFWRTTKTSVNSINYFTDGTISDMYFVVEGYLKNLEEKS
jgi:molybdenum cofactor biosynthesis enzyme MoaA